MTVFSEGNIRRHKIGEGVFVEGDQSKEIYYENAAGTVWLAEDQTLKMRNVNDELTKYLDILKVNRFNKEKYN